MTDTTFTSVIPVANFGQHDVFALPDVSKLALIKRGLRVVLGSEAARTVHTLRGKLEDPALATDDWESTQLAAAQQALWDKIVAGTFGHREPGVSGRAPVVTDPVEKEARALARQEITDILKSENKAFPTRGKAVEFAEGVSLDGETLIARRLAKHGDRLRGEARKIVAARQRAMAKGTEDGGTTLADLL